MEAEGKDTLEEHIRTYWERHLGVHPLGEEDGKHNMAEREHIKLKIFFERKNELFKALNQMSKMTY